MSTETALATFQPQSITEAMDLSKTLATSGLLPDGLKGKPQDILVTIITGRELGLSVMQAIRGMYVVKGKAVMSSDLTVALVKRYQECLYFRLVNSNEKAATYVTRRRGDTEDTVMTFSIEDAQRAGLNGDNWRKYPAAMLRARCAQHLARAVYQDLVQGVYDPDEAREFSDRPPVEKDVTPEFIEGEIVPEIKVTKTTRLAEKLAAKAEKPVEAKSPWEQILEAGLSIGMEPKEIGTIVKSVCKREKSSEVVLEDVVKFQDYIGAFNLKEGNGQ